MSGSLGSSGSDPWNFDALGKAPAISPAPVAFTDSDVSRGLPSAIRALCFEGLPYRGKPTRVFAFYGRPVTATPNAKVPGIVLVHGGGGTAFSDWVARWVSCGYAAIAMDHDGGLPIGSHGAWASNPENAGPKRVGAGDVFEPVVDQWMFHAVADAVLAASLLASFPEVDAVRIGISGISWGAVVACNAAAVDPRLKFAALVYGCGYIAENEDDGSRFIEQSSAWTEASERATVWRELWDPARRLRHVTTPMLWLNGTNDFAFTPHAWRRSHRLASGTRALCLRVRMPHGHGEAGEGPKEIHAFADSITRDRRPLARSLGERREGQVAYADFKSETPLLRAELNFTRDGGRWQDRRWETLPARLDGGRVQAKLPEDAKIAYFNVIDERELIASSDLILVE